MLRGDVWDFQKESSRGNTPTQPLVSLSAHLGPRLRLVIVCLYNLEGDTLLSAKRICFFPSIKNTPTLRHTHTHTHTHILLTYSFIDRPIGYSTQCQHVNIFNKLPGYTHTAGPQIILWSSKAIWKFPSELVA